MLDQSYELRHLHEVVARIKPQRPYSEINGAFCLLVGGRAALKVIEYGLSALVEIKSQWIAENCEQKK
jgi:hypothetical protein